MFLDDRHQMGVIFCLKSIHNAIMDGQELRDFAFIAVEGQETVTAESREGIIEKIQYPCFSVFGENQMMEIIIDFEITAGDDLIAFGAIVLKDVFTLGDKTAQFFDV